MKVKTYLEHDRINYFPLKAIRTIIIMYIIISSESVITCKTFNLVCVSSW